MSDMENKKRKMRQEELINRVFHDMVQRGDIMYAVIGEGSKVPVIIGKNKNCTILNKKQFMQMVKTSTRKLYESIGEVYSNPDCTMLTSATLSTIFDTGEVCVDLQLKHKVQPFAFLSEDTYTFARIPFDPFDTVQLTPLWDSFLSNFSNAIAIRIWIGSLFFPDSDRSQYLWLYGKGGNGKSTLARIIATVLGLFVRFEQAPGKDDKYWTNGLIGKRLIVLDDCNHYGFVKTGLFKSLTGSSKVRVEPKYCAPYDTDLDCKFLFTSNEMPMISNEIADQRRIIFSSAINKEVFEYDPDFHSGLEEELPAFISNCMLLYEEYCADGRPIPSDQTEALELGGCFDEEIEAWLERNFAYDATCFTPTSTFRHQLSFTKLDSRRVYKFLEGKDLRSKVHFIANKSVRGIKGLRLICEQVDFKTGK